MGAPTCLCYFKTCALIRCVIKGSQCINKYLFLVWESGLIFLTQIMTKKLHMGESFQDYSCIQDFEADFP